MSARHARLVRACRCWAQADLYGLLPCFHRDVAFCAQSPPGAPSLLGAGLGKTLFAHRLGMFLDEYAVVAFEAHHSSAKGFWRHSHARYRYLHRASAMPI